MKAHYFQYPGYLEGAARGGITGGFSVQASLLPYLRPEYDSNKDCAYCLDATYNIPTGKVVCIAGKIFPRTYVRQ